MSPASTKETKIEASSIQQSSQRWRYNTRKRAEAPTEPSASLSDAVTQTELGETKDIATQTDAGVAAAIQTSDDDEV